jgi:acetyl-CoA synthetase
VAETQDQTTENLEKDLEKLLEENEKFEPPEEFKEKALWSDPAIYDEVSKDISEWWAGHAKDDLHWFQEWDQVLDDSNPPFYKWFVGGKTNMSYNCLDRHVEAGNGDRVAFHWRGEEGETRDITYEEFLRDTQKLANGLKELGIEPGDVVGIYLPMVPEVVVAMLACARIGAVHNVVFGGFSPGSVKERMEVSEAKALITTDGARRKGKTNAIKSAVDEEMGDLETLEKIIVVKATDDACEMKDGRDHWYHELLENADDECPAEELDAEHPLFILYSSGSTAKPKGILHTTGGYMTGVKATTKYTFDLRPEEDVFWCSADVGWITGHSYIVYGPMLNGATSVMFEGAPDYPDKDVWWKICDELDVSIFYTSPTAIRAAMKWGPEHPQKHDLSNMRLLGSVGEPINPKAWAWYHQVIGGGRCPIVDTWWQTETGQIMISPLPGITATKPGSATVPFPGIKAAVYDEEGNPMEEGQGLLVLECPWPGMLRTLYQDDDRYVETYWDKFGKDKYVVGDAARKDEDGYIWVLGRIDDVVNVSGHRLSTAEIESAVVSFETVAECAVIGKQDEDSGQAVVAFVTLEGDDSEGSDDLEQEIREHVGKKIGKFARPKEVVWAADLPKTRSGKIMRRLLRDIAEGNEVGDVSTLREPGVMDDLASKMEKDGDSE